MVFSLVTSLEDGTIDEADHLGPGGCSGLESCGRSSRKEEIKYGADSLRRKLLRTDGKGSLYDVILLKRMYFF